MVRMAENVLENAKKLVKELYDFRDNFLSQYGTDAASNKNKEVEMKMKETLHHLDDLQMSIDNKAVFFSLRGQTLNVTPDYNPNAVDCLSKAVKLDPSLVDAWNSLGECYWKNKDIEAAKNCFTGALGKERDKKTLRNLSMVLRQIGKDTNERVENVNKSLDIAKEAIAMDVTDGLSWFVLGNAYLSLFFLAGQNMQNLRQAMAAYSRAEQDVLAANNPDLHYNRAMAYRYQEDYELALQDYTKTVQLDPEWAEPRNELSELVKYLETCVEMIDKKGKVKHRKLTHLVQSIKESDLGPYGGGHFTSALGKKTTLNACLFDDLQQGTNTERVVYGKVANFVPSSWTVCFSFVLVDSASTCIPVTVYNLAAGKEFLVGDSIAIPEPFVHESNISFGEKVLHFRSIRVENPMLLVLNKRKVGTDRVALGSITFVNKSD